MKKTCEQCRFLNTGYYGEGICDFFGEDIPDWANNGNEGCLLKCQEIKKAISISDKFLHCGTSKELDEYGFPKWTKEDTKHNQKVTKEYNEYLEVLKMRCKERRKK